jgi:hypothetical protein
MARVPAWAGLAFSPAALGEGLTILEFAAQAALFAELFPVEVRYSGASLGYQLGAVIGGGFAPIMATA